MVGAIDGLTITVLRARNVFEIGFSPFGTHVITWERPSKTEQGDAVKNLKVWRVIKADLEESETEGEYNVVGRFVQKSATGWNLQYTQDECYCARVVSNEVHFYQSSDLATVWNKLRIEGVVDFSVSPGQKPAIAVFMPERKVRMRCYYWDMEELCTNKSSLFQHL